MSAHTPGPWVIYEPDVNSLELRDGCGGYICELTTEGCEIPPDARANARLIAAAPDLLEALKDMVNGIDNEIGRSRTDTNFPKARAAIAKAEAAA